MEFVSIPDTNLYEQENKKHTLISKLSRLKIFEFTKTWNLPRLRTKLAVSASASISDLALVTIPSSYGAVQSIKIKIKIIFYHYKIQTNSLLK